MVLCLQMNALFKAPGFTLFSVSEARSNSAKASLLRAASIASKAIYDNPKIACTCVPLENCIKSLAHI